jgi:hypothetical protein
MQGRGVYVSSCGSVLLTQESPTAAEESRTAADPTGHGWRVGTDHRAVGGWVGGWVCSLECVKAQVQEALTHRSGRRTTRNAVTGCGLLAAHVLPLWLLCQVSVCVPVGLCDVGGGAVDCGGSLWQRPCGWLLVRCRACELIVTRKACVSECWCNRCGCVGRGDVSHVCCQGPERMQRDQTHSKSSKSSRHDRAPSCVYVDGG